MPDLYTSETVTGRHQDGVAEIRLNRPERLNAVIEPLYDDLLVALDHANAEPAVRVVVLTGEGRAFCVGADLKEHARATRTDFDKRSYLIKANAVCQRMRALPKPLIAAVNGFALGAGAEMALCADFLLMKDSAEIGFPEVAIGTFVGGGVTHVLPRLVGLAKARELIFLGERVTGAAAVAMGLATKTFPDADFASGVDAFARRLAKLAPVSMALAKTHFTADRDYEASLVTELEGIRACMATHDWHEGVAAFAEKRPPRFRGS